VGKYLYDRGDNRHKHHWNKPEAGFHPSHRGPIGKCSNKINQELAQTLLDEGIEYRSEDFDYPEKIYNVYEGVPYVAVPTLPGVSYHGYPWRGRMPRRILRRLEAMAADEGYADQFKSWLKDYSEVSA
jgi:hypothetical protein